jgi:hypothetical protein
VLVFIGLLLAGLAVTMFDSTSENSDVEEQREDLNKDSDSKDTSLLDLSDFELSQLELDTGNAGELELEETSLNDHHESGSADSELIETSDGSDLEVNGDAEGFPFPEELELNSGNGSDEKDLVFSESPDGSRFDEIHGNGGNDRLYVSNGTYAFGGEGNDMIILRDLFGDGDTVLATGGAGEDSFLVEAGNASNDSDEHDIITDFTPGKDLLGVIIEDQTFGDEYLSGTISYSVGQISVECREGGAFVSISINQYLNSDDSVSGNETLSKFVRSVFLEGVSEFDPSAIVIVKDWQTFAQEHLGLQSYSSVIFPANGDLAHK